MTSLGRAESDRSKWDRTRCRRTRVLFLMVIVLVVVDLLILAVMVGGLLAAVHSPQANRQKSEGLWLVHSLSGWRSRNGFR